MCPQLSVVPNSQHDLLLYEICNVGAITKIRRVLAPGKCMEVMMLLPRYSANDALPRKPIPIEPIVDEPRVFAQVDGRTVIVNKVSLRRRWANQCRELPHLSVAALLFSIQIISSSPPSNNV